MSSKSKMFLNFLKDFATKKIVKRNLAAAKNEASGGKIETVGIIFDESSFTDKDAVIDALIAQGISEDYIRILVFRSRIKKNETFPYPVFSYRDLSWSATLEKADLKAFTDVKFDLLINYYDVEKVPLLAASIQSKALFKTGFASVDKRLNNFMIDTTVNQYAVFTDELFKYLRILNKL